jgi:enoyl-CoA hydratase/carnithine racemase
VNTTVTPTTQDVVVSRGERWIEIRIDRPEKMNALREQTAHEILETLAEAEDDRDVAAVILHGSERAFCTGIDTSEFAIGPGEMFDFYRKRRRSRKTGRLFRTLPDYTKPVICVVEGYALGGGFELALCADLIVAGEKASFGLPEAKLGMMPGGGGTQTLARLVGKPLAKELIWTGRRLSAQDALGYRIVNHVTPSGEALAKARELAAAIGAAAPISVMMSKAAIERGADMSLANGMAYEGDASFLLYLTDDRGEGLTAFREKRAPSFNGR